MKAFFKLSLSSLQPAYSTGNRRLTLLFYYHTSLHALSSALQPLKYARFKSAAPLNSKACRGSTAHGFKADALRLSASVNSYNVLYPRSALVLNAAVATCVRTGWTHLYSVRKRQQTSVPSFCSTMACWRFSTTESASCCMRRHRGGVAWRESTHTRALTHTSCTPPSIYSVLYCSVLSPSCEQRRGISASSSVPPRCPLGLKCPFIARRYLIGSSISPYRCAARTSASLYSRRLALLVLGL